MADDLGRTTWYSRSGEAARFAVTQALCPPRDDQLYEWRQKLTSGGYRTR